MSKNPNLFLLAEGLILTFLLALRVATIYQAGLIDYDAVRNWQIVTEIGHGNFSHLFHHLSPGFFLLFAGWQPFSPGIYFYPIFNAVFNVAGIWLLVRWFKAESHISPVWYLLLLALTGSSFLLISTARTFSIESPSLLVFAVIFITYFRRFATQNTHYFYLALIGLAVALTINYKFILLLPIALVFEAWQRDQVIMRRHWLKGMCILGAILPVSILHAWYVGLKPLQYIYAYESFFLSGDANAANRSGFLRWDIDFYGRYLLDFEAWLLIPGILLFSWYNRNALVQQKSLAGYLVFTFWVTICWLAGMSVLLKAPRGILFSVPLLYLLAFWGWQQLLAGRNFWLFLILIGGMAQNIYRYTTQIWPYRQTNYTEVGGYFTKHPAGAIISTVSIMPTPFLPAGRPLIPISRTEQLDTITAQKYAYLLLDNYIDHTQVTGFLMYKRLPPLATWIEPTLQPFYFYLEHAEFTGFNYRQTHQIYEAARRDSVQIRLLPMTAVLKLYRQEKLLKTTPGK